MIAPETAARVDALYDAADVLEDRARARDGVQLVGTTADKLAKRRRRNARDRDRARDLRKRADRLALYGDEDDAA